LLSLGLACWPRRGSAKPTAQFQALLTYNVLVALFFSYLGVGGALVGKLLWFAVAFHAALAVLLARAWFVAERFNRID
jgi:hypothetical protein